MAFIVTTQRIGIQTRYKRTERHKKQSFGIIYAIILTLKGNPVVARRALRLMIPFRETIKEETGFPVVSLRSTTGYIQMMP